MEIYILIDCVEVSIEAIKIAIEKIEKDIINSKIEKDKLISTKQKLLQALNKNEP